MCRPPGERTFAAENNDRLTKRDREFDETKETDYWRLEGLKEGGVGIWQRTSGINWAYRLEKIPNGGKIETELRNVQGCKN